MKRNTKIYLTSGIVASVLLIVGISYALWVNVFTQSGNNAVNSDCFDVSFEEGKGIYLENTFPIYDIEGKKLTPYTLTVKNLCSNEVRYQMNLETMNNTTMSDGYIKVMVGDSEPYILSSKEETSPTIQNAKSAYILELGNLEANEVKEYQIRIWMDEHVTQNDEGAMNGVFESKITFTATYLTPLLADVLKNVSIVEEGSGLYEVHHEDAEITYTADEESIHNLKQTELRYAGSDPDNYVEFNNELWRMIGLVNTPEGQRVKLVRNESIGSYSWDSSASHVNNGYGINEWSESDLMRLLNQGAYYNRTNETCYNDKNDAMTECDFSNSGLTKETKGMIDTITWNLGSNGTVSNISMDVFSFYNLERSNNIGKICNSGSYCNDEIDRNFLWQGQVGVIYPSDYGYATTGGNSLSREQCLITPLYDWNEENLAACKNNTWIFGRWTMMPMASSTTASRVFSIYSTGKVHLGDAGDKSFIFPCVYLKENVRISSGIGTADNPYLLQMS